MRSGACPVNPGPDLPEWIPWSILAAFQITHMLFMVVVVCFSLFWPRSTSQAHPFCSNTCWVPFCDLGSMGYYLLSLVVLIFSTQAFPLLLTQLHSSVVTARLAKSLRIRALIGRPPYISRAPLRESSHWWTKSEACLRKFHSVYLRSTLLLFCRVSKPDGSFEQFYPGTSGVQGENLSSGAANGPGNDQSLIYTSC